MNSNSQKLACANKESVGSDLSKMVLNMYNVKEDATLHRQNCCTHMYKILSDFFRYVIKKISHSSKYHNCEQLYKIQASNQT